MQGSQWLFIQIPTQGDTLYMKYLKIKKKLQANLNLATFSELTTLSHPSAV
jgi:hypothetical protein